MTEDSNIVMVKRWRDNFEPGCPEMPGGMSKECLKSTGQNARWPRVASWVQYHVEKNTFGSANLISDSRKGCDTAAKLLGACQSIFL